MALMVEICTEEIDIVFFEKVLRNFEAGLSIMASK